MSLLDLTLPDHAHLFGFALGDGTLTSSTRQRGRLTIELAACDEEHVERLAGVVPVRTTITRRRRSTNFSSAHESVVLSAFDLAFRRELIALGFPPGRKSTTIAPPRGPYAQRDFFRGLVDADGSLGFARQGWPFVSLCTSSDVLAAAYAEFVEFATGQRKVVRPNARDGARNLMVTREVAQALAAELYYEGAVALPRKRERAAAVAAWMRPLDMPRGAPRQAWTPEEDAIVLERPTREACAILGRTVNSVVLRRRRLRRVAEAA